MPEYAFCGTVPHQYPETRDSHGVIVGRVAYGDTREFDGPWNAVAPEAKDEDTPPWRPAPTADWFAADGPLPKRLPDEDSEDGKDAAERPPEPPAIRPPAAKPKPLPPATTPPDGASESEG